MQALDITGNRYTRLLVIKRHGSIHAGATWECLCDCGNTKIVVGHALRNGLVKSCGCLLRTAIADRVRKHGMSSSSTYKIWEAMIQRCTNPNNLHYNNYGGRGIKVCKRWQKFENFLADMGERPKNYSLDRKNNDKGYSASNCRWATRKEQQNNMRTNKVITYKGKSMTPSQWSEITGLKAETIRSRLNKGWTPKDILTRPVR